MTSGEGSGTSGSAGVTGGMRPGRARGIGFAVFLAAAVLQAGVNIYSRLSDLHTAGAQPDTPSIVLDETTSLVAWFLCLLVIWKLVARIRPPRFGWTATLGLHALATIPVSLLHVALMVAMREAGHALAGENYDFTDNLAASLLYEYRKDAMSYILLAAFAAGVQWISRGSEASPVPAAPGFIEIPDGATTHRIPLSEIDRVEASGNYVTLHWGRRELLHRMTLAALADELGDGFARIHRSRMVRKDSVRSIEKDRSGDFTVTLADGTQLRGSRRYRGDLA